MRPALIALLFTTLTAPALAQTTKEKCAAIAGPMMEASDGVATMMQAMMKVDYGEVASAFSSDEAAHFGRLGASQEALLPHMKLFLAELEATALAMRSCAR